MAYKNTLIRNMVLDVISKANEPLSVNDIFNALYPEHDINLVTIYRTVHTMERYGIIKRELIRKDSRTYYSLKQTSEEQHKHYLECTRCHKKIKLESCPYSSVSKNIVDKYGFLIEETSVLYGICKDCLKNA